MGPPRASPAAYLLIFASAVLTSPAIVSFVSPIVPWTGGEERSGCTVGDSCGACGNGGPEGLSLRGLGANAGSCDGLGMPEFVLLGSSVCALRRSASSLLGSIMSSESRMGRYEVAGLSPARENTERIRARRL